MAKGKGPGGRGGGSAWHIDQMGPPPRLGCLGMCTEQCAVMDVNSKCLRNMFVPAYKTRQMGQVWKVSEPEGVGGASESVGGFPEGVGECR